MTLLLRAAGARPRRGPEANTQGQRSGEVVDLADSAAGTPVGWDLSGVIERPARMGTGFALGTRVFGLVWCGAWAELVAVPTRQLAPVPPGVSDADAAALPTAGLTALRSLELGGFVLGRRVLVSGSTGGVGRYAVQLAARAGATVTALVRDVAKSTAGLRQLGADEVVEQSKVTSISWSTPSAVRRSRRRLNTSLREASS